MVLSFGRGKPVSLLGGGAVLHRDKALSDFLPEGVAKSMNGNIQRFLLSVKAFLYNQMISPRLYWIPQRLPFLQLGETRYHPLSDVMAMDRARFNILPVNIASYRGYSLSVQKAICEMIEKLESLGSEIMNLSAACQVSQERDIDCPWTRTLLTS